MKQQLASLLMVAALAAACGGSPASESPAASTTPSAVACNLPAEVSAAINTAAATATAIDFVGKDSMGNAVDVALLPAGASAFNGHKFYFAANAQGDAARAGLESDEARGNFTAGGAGYLVTGIVSVPSSSGNGDTYSNISSSLISGELAVRMGDLQPMLQMTTGGLAGLFAAPDAGAARRIGGIAIGADALFYEVGSSAYSASKLGFDNEMSPAFDFPILAIAHHPSAASADAAFAAFDAAAGDEKVSFCVNGSMVEFAVANETQLGLGTTTGDGMLAVAKVEVDGGHYLIARGVKSVDGAISVSSMIVNDEFQLAAWPTGSISK